MITFALPTHKNADIIWLQLESLCAQKDASEWELIVCEENSDQYFGKENLAKYKTRLEKAGCVSIKYIEVDEWVPLGKKWMLIRDNMNPESIAMIIDASDNYSPSDRIKKAYDSMVAGNEWCQTLSGNFYNILNGESSVFKAGENMPALFMCISKTALDRIKSKDYPKKSVDTWLFKQSKPSSIENFEFESNGLHTDGMNTISLHRRGLYKTGGLFSEADTKTVLSGIPAKIVKRLNSLKS